MDSSPKLNHDDWIKEQSEDSDINLIVQLLKFESIIKEPLSTNFSICATQ